MHGSTLTCRLCEFFSRANYGDDFAHDAAQTPLLYPSEFLRSLANKIGIVDSVLAFVHTGAFGPMAAGRLEKLNPQQRRAVEHGGSALGEAGPLLIIAGAGSGKTSTLAHRVALSDRATAPIRAASCS